MNLNLYSKLNWISLVIVLLALLPGVPFAEAKEIRREVNLEWEPIDGATSYEIQVTRVLKDGVKKKPLLFKLKKAKWSANINPGRYEMLIRSYDHREVPGDWADPVEFWVKIGTPAAQFPALQAKVKADSSDQEKIDFKWAAVEGAEAYELNILSEDGNIKENKKVQDLSAEIELPVAKKYNWTVTALMPEGGKGEETDVPNTFTLVGSKLEKPKIEKPISKFVKSIKWNRPEHVDSFSYALYKKEADGKLKFIEKKQGLNEDSAPFDLSRPSGKYVLKVMAQGQARQNSEISDLEFEVKGDLRSPAAIENAILKDSLEKPTNFYAIASYFITQMNYTSQKFDTAQRAQFDAIGGTGRIGIGYQNPEAPWGTFGIMDMGGFNIGNKNFNFTSIEIHGTWKLNLSATNQVLLGAGVYSKELPEVQGTATTGFTDVGKSESQGPHAGMQIWFPLSQKLGVQLNGRVYYSLIGKGPGGEPIESAISYQTGLLGSLRLTNSMMGYAGYAYRQDEARYKADTSSPFSFAKPGDVNVIQMQGHYLNLMLEYSF